MLDRNKYCQLKSIVVLGLLFLGLAGSGEASPLELGLTLGPGYRAPNRFDSGISNYTSSLTANTPGITENEPLRNTSSEEFWIRSGTLIGGGHMPGFTVGQLNLPEIQVTEYRGGTNPSITQTSWTFDISYFMFQYYYTKQLRRKIHWEFEVGMGFVPQAKWRVRGYTANAFSLSEHNSTHQARFGGVWRLGLGLSGPISRHFMWRTGLRFTHLQISDFSGNLNGLDSDWFYTANGKMAQLSERDVINLPNTLNDSLYGVIQTAIIAEQVDMASSMFEIYFSVGFRL